MRYHGDRRSPGTTNMIALDEAERNPQKDRASRTAVSIAAPLIQRNLCSRSERRRRFKARQWRASARVYLPADVPLRAHEIQGRDATRAAAHHDYSVARQRSGVDGSGASFKTAMPASQARA
jgi:hypothetical protein